MNYLDGPPREHFMFLVHDEDALREGHKNLVKTLQQVNHEWLGRKPRASAPLTAVAAYKNSPRNDAYKNNVCQRDKRSCCISHTKHSVPTEVGHTISSGVKIDRATSGSP